MGLSIPRRLVSLLPVMLLGVLGVATTTFAQGGTSTASLAGKIVDDTGARLPGVTVTVTSLGTNQSRTVVSNEEGLYRFAGLQPGNYNFTLDPGSSGYQGQTVASYVGPDGICLNWGVSTTSPAVATAQPGTTCDPAAAPAAPPK